jgi:hypothetical protein
MRRLIALSLLLTLAACGKAGAPVVPNSSFPHMYPNPKLQPTQTAAPEDQPGMAAQDGKAKFTAQGTYIDPSVKDTELRRSTVAPGATLPYTQTTVPGNNTPFNQTLGVPGSSPLGPAPGTQSPDEVESPP